MPAIRLGFCVTAALCVAAARLPGAVIRGSVVEHQTGRALARATVTLEPVEGTPGKPLTARTPVTGHFAFSELAPGVYFVKAERRGFMTAWYGQKRWNSAGAPVVLTADAAPFLDIRLPRYSGVAGTVVDENDVGLPDVEVVAYHATQPPQLAGRGKSDDRGVYRIPGLTPGDYLVRSAAQRGEFLDYLPTFSRETLRVEEARQAHASLDDDARNVDVRPLPGRLFSITGSVTPAATPVGPITVTLAWDMGRLTSQGPIFHFQGLPPGPFEIYAEAKEEPGARFQSGFTRLTVGGDTSAAVLLGFNDTRFDVTPALAEGSGARVLARRIDLAGRGHETTLELKRGRTSLAFGRWELMLLPPAGQYVESVSGVAATGGSRLRPDGWNEIEARQYTVVRYGLAAGPASLRGVVRAGGEAVAGAPVYLEAYDPSSRRRLIDLKSTRSDVRGGYRFDGLAPGNYRVLATFEYQAPDAVTMDAAQATAIRIEPRGDAQSDLTLYELR